MVYLLEAFGHQTLQAHDGAEGIEIAKQEKPDLILLDIHMPRMDGYEVATSLRGNSDCCKIPLVAVTALAMVGDRERILASGFGGYIAKPIDPEAFAIQVQGFLGAAYSVPERVSPPKAPNAPEMPEPSSPKSPKRGLVLFVDNSQTNAELIRSTLQPSGYEVLVARSAREGFDLARATPPDLIISDIHMPQQDGYAFRRMIKAEPGLAMIPFIFLSSSVSSARERERALQEGAQKFLARPIEAEVLLSEVYECLESAGTVRPPVTQSRDAGH